ncbi:two pore domain potassium channel family protein [Candidatus Woesebacteria bacterium]|nr:two pore domain potassium channel family protein [Candidatus Woesebacteria bacterium]
MQSTFLNHRLLSQKRFKRVLVSLIFVAVFLGIVIVPLELQAPHANITTFFDGFWWAITTVTTVGYGDAVPVTVPGKSIGMILQVIGVALFGSMIGIITVYLSRVEKEYHWKKLYERLDDIEEKLDSLKKQGEYMVKNDEEGK